MSLTLSSFDCALSDGADDVDAFIKILPDDLEDLPNGVLRLCVEEKAPRCLTALLKKYPGRYPVNEATKKEKATALHLAAAFCPQETSRYIITCSGGGDTDGCHPFTGFMAGQMIDALLEAGADGTLRDKQGDTPFDIFRKLRTMSSWEGMLMTESTIMGIIPNKYHDKHTRIKKDLARVQKVLMEASQKKPEKTKAKRKASVTASRSTNSKKKTKSEK